MVKASRKCIAGSKLVTKLKAYTNIAASKAINPCAPLAFWLLFFVVIVMFFLRLYLVDFLNEESRPVLLYFPDCCQSTGCGYNELFGEESALGFNAINLMNFCVCHGGCG